MCVVVLTGFYRILGSARALACWLRRLAATKFYLGKVSIVFDYLSGQTALEKVRAGEGASASTRGACAPQKLTQRA